MQRVPQEVLHRGVRREALGEGVPARRNNFEALFENELLGKKSRKLFKAVVLIRLQAVLNVLLFRDHAFNVRAFFFVELDLEE